jgi:hypothetical protein
MSSIRYLQRMPITKQLIKAETRNGRMGAPYGREQTAELATEAGQDVN